MASRALVLLALGACGRFGFDPSAPADGSQAGDGPKILDAALCSALSPPDWLASAMPLDANKQYVVSDDGTIATDHITGLRWQREPPATLYLPVDAATYCASLVLDGCARWRVPQRIELATLVDHRFADPVTGPPFTTPIDRPFVTASLDPNNGSSWIINLDNGNTFFNTPGETYHVQCVHSEVAPRVPPMRYEVGTASVLDVDTGLTWLSALDPSTETQGSAAAYCANQPMAGGKQWRLPEIGELETLIDRSRQSPAVDPTAFPGIPSTVVWSTSIFGVAGMVMDFTSGNVVNQPPSTLYDVICVH